MEYGTIIGSNPPPKTPNVMKSSENITQKESSKASPKKGYKEKTSIRAKLAPRVLDQLSSRNEEIVTSELIEWDFSSILRETGGFGGVYGDHNLPYY